MILPFVHDMIILLICSWLLHMLMLQLLLLQHMHVFAVVYCQAIANCRFIAWGSWNAD